jgi:hypothetical protein
MADKELRKLQKIELLEILVDQRKRIDELEKELAEVREQLESREINIRNSGSIAEASLKLTKVFYEAQKAADLYLENVRRQLNIKTDK